MKLRCKINYEDDDNLIMIIETKNQDKEWEIVAHRKINRPKDTAQYLLRYLNYTCVSEGGGQPYFRVSEIKI